MDRVPAVQPDSCRFKFPLILCKFLEPFFKTSIMFCNSTTFLKVGFLEGVEGGGGVEGEWHRLQRNMGGGRGDPRDLETLPP